MKSLGRSPKGDKMKVTREDLFEEVKLALEDGKEDLSPEEFSKLLGEVKEHVAILMDGAKDEARSQRGGA